MTLLGEDANRSYKELRLPIEDEKKRPSVEQSAAYRAELCNLPLSVTYACSSPQAMSLVSR